MGGSSIDEGRIDEDVYTFALLTGVRDAYGRMVGGLAYVRAHGDGFELWVRSARDGQPYGALAPSSYPPTFEAARCEARAKLKRVCQRVRGVAARQSDGIYRTAGNLRRARGKAKG